jgi:RNA polymerase sigma-70 factor (ECF subfamily)
MLPDTPQDQPVSGYTTGIGRLAPTPLGRETRMSRMENTELIRAAQRGDAAAFEQLVHQYDRAVLRVAIHLTGSRQDGQDLYQEAFLRAYLKLPSFRFECSFYTWIYRIVTNLGLDHLRKKRLRCRYSTAMFSPDGEQHDASDQVSDEQPLAHPEHNFAARVLDEHLIRSLAMLSPRERMVFELKHYHGLQLKTVAGILNTTERIAKNTLFRATHKLRSRLAELR